LSSEFSTYLSGRYVELEVHPLSFREFLEFKEERKKDIPSALKEYMRMGGLPYVALGRMDAKETEEIISAIYDTVFIKDIIERNQIRDTGNIRNISLFVMNNIGNLTSVRSISNYILSKGGKISPPTAESYLRHLEAHFFYTAPTNMMYKKRNICEQQISSMPQTWGSGTSSRATTKKTKQA
jgi:predicted AAA+ superfamily ATPase